jgi:hypothetical protein
MVILIMYNLVCLHYFKPSCSTAVAAGSYRMLSMVPLTCRCIPLSSRHLVNRVIVAGMAHRDTRICNQPHTAGSWS